MSFCNDSAASSMDEATTREQVIEHVRDIDAQLGRIYDDEDSYRDVMDKTYGVLTNEALKEVVPLETERRRLIRYLEATGGLPNGLTKTY